MKEIHLIAKAKINLGLDVVRKREDGYHEVRMIMQMIDLYDKIVLSQKKESGIAIRTNLSFLPENENNLAYRAAKLLMDEFDVKEGLSISLTKHIPVAAGMAGGSTDAAAVMIGVNRLFRLNLTKKELMERAVNIGADVPFCIMRGTALAEGIGEKLTALPDMPHCYILIAKPKVHVSTKYVYSNLKADELESHPDIDGQIRALKDQDLQALTAQMGHVLETVTVPAYPVIDEIKRKMMKYGALGAMMSGSGPTVFGIFERELDAQNAYRELKKGNEAKQVYLIRQ